MDRPVPLPSEGETSLSPGRAAWQAAALDAGTRARAAADAAMYRALAILEQCLSEVEQPDGAPPDSR